MDQRTKISDLIYRFQSCLSSIGIGAISIQQIQQWERLVKAQIRSRVKKAQFANRAAARTPVICNSH
jgi:hypothetical protein